MKCDVSVRSAAPGVPNFLLFVTIDSVFGPVITKVVKSIRNEQISSLAGHTVKPQVVRSPVVILAVVQYVIFSDDELPHDVITNVQQTPKPSAQDPELVPSLSEHSALV